MRGETYIGQPCKHGHSPERYVSNRKCVECNRQFHKILVDSVCEHCGETYQRPISQVKRRFCNERCKDANNLEARGGYQAVKEKKYAERWARRDFIRAYKLEKGCEVCGYKEHPAALQLDHLDPNDKKYTLSQCISRSWTALHEELPKCRVLCANCHAVHTDNQITSGVFLKITKEKDNAVQP